MKKRVYDGFNKIDIIELEIKGRRVKREKLILPDAVAGLVVNQNSEMAIVHQFRPSIAQNSMEIPAGILDKKLTNVEILQEELYEECGIDPSDIVYISPKPIDKYYINIGSSDAVLELYLVRVKNVRSKRMKVNDPDVDFVSWKTLAEMQELSDQGSIRDPKTIIAFNFFKDMMVTPPTEKQIRVIDIIEKTLGYRFIGKTLEEASAFIGKHIEESKKVGKGLQPGVMYNPSHIQAYSMLSQLGMPDIDIDFDKTDLLSLDANQLMRRAYENMERDNASKERTCDNCGETRFNSHLYLCQSCYDSFPSGLGDVTGEPQNNGHYGMPDQGDVGEGAFSNNEEEFHGGGLPLDEYEDPDVGF